jgi:hypothetical protein
LPRTSNRDGSTGRRTRIRAPTKPSTV